MANNQSHLPPRLSDLHGSARVEALRARAAADRERFLRERDGGTGFLAKWAARFVR